MSSTILSVMFAEPVTQPNPAGEGMKMLGMIVFFIAVMYLVMIRPQQKKAKEAAQMIKAIKPGDKILTTSGIVATIITVKENTLSVRSADTKLEILKSAVAEVTERAGEASES